MNNKSVIILGFGLPIAFLLIMGIFVMKPSLAKVEKPATDFYYATKQWGTFQTQTGNDFPLFVNGGKIAFQNRVNIFAECQLIQTWVNNQTVMVTPNPLPAICTEKDTARLLTHAYEQGLKIYKHDVVKNQSELLTVDQVVGIAIINDSTKSPEGYILDTNGYYNGGNDLLFGGGASRYRSGAFLANNRKRIEMNVRAATGDPSISFLGWTR